MDSDQDDAEVTTRTLVESLIREDATVDAGELYDVANALGMSDQQVRLCIKRLAAEGRFTQDGRGRKAILRATERTRTAIEPDLEFVRFMYAQDRGEARWDGRWHLAAFGIPESMRSARDTMRNAIVRLGGALIQGGLYVSANPWEDHILTLATELDVRAHISLLTTEDLAVGDSRTAPDLARRLWPLDRIVDGHRRLLAAAQRLKPAIPGASRTEHLRIAITLAAEFTRAIEPDPLLPPDLLPQPWTGTAARAAVAECWADLLEAEPAQPIRLFRWYAEVVQEVTRPINTS
ncbi:PaaX family transcriptional regulator C-terminal domain-containing protein [Mycobacteroides sp. LB1]|uniref:PaaX family transcriptional regulator C-terminal domain-containing protein n=1 Tax=Mycobacteroides sp. LB1 TaxID=2750814 RepID=UPI0015DF163E|nr:transcriptional regulator [Mycobacteroides sp. LB1]